MYNCNPVEATVTWTLAISQVVTNPEKTLTTLYLSKKLLRSMTQAAVSRDTVRRNEEKKGAQSLPKDSKKDLNLTVKEEL